MSDITNPTDNSISAKEISKKAMIFSAIWIAVLSIAKGVLALFGKNFLEMGDIITSGIAIVGVFSPVSVSVWLEKIQGIIGSRGGK